MRIGLVTDSIEMGSPGLRRYSINLADALMEIDGTEVTLVHRGAGADPYYQDKPTLKIWNPRLPFAGKQMVFRHMTSGRAFDVLHDTYHFPPFLVPLPYAKVMTVADLTGLTMNTHRLKNRMAHMLLFPTLVRRADHVVAISEHTRKDVIERLRLDPARVTATPLAASPHLRPVQDRLLLEAVRDRYGLPEAFLLYVGTIEPRKNLGRLVEAFAAIAPRLPGFQLVLAGPAGWGTTGLEALATRLGIAPRVRLIGRVDEGDLAALYGLARVFVFPSLYEGFGLPPLEAMQCGCPVITSNVSSLPEIAGEAARLVDPLEVDDIARAILDVASKPALRAEMRRAGLRQAATFSWRRCAEQTFAVYEDLVAGRRTWRQAA